MGDSQETDIPEWKRPDQVMQLHRLKIKKRALQARMIKTNFTNTESQLNLSDQTNNLFSGSKSRTVKKRKNPFVKNDSNKRTREPIPLELDVSTDSVLCELLHIKAPNKTKSTTLEQNVEISFANILTKLKGNDVPIETEVNKGEKYMPIDWTLNTKMRFMSPKPFPWNGKLKTSEEASGTTGFVRCLNIRDKETTLDTSPNARFHQCCLVWQHPSLPWLELFPRSAGRLSASLASNSAIAVNQCIKDSLFKDWTESFRSLFHLLRARQCPYFYVCANTFTVLFRAAGICGLSEIHALLTPTTRGFRQNLKQEDIEYTMPLRKDDQRHLDVKNVDCKNVEPCASGTVTSLTNENQLCNEEEDEPEDQWLQSLGVEDSEIRKINHSQTRMILEKESKVDSLKQSLVFIKGVEVQALFNFLINCKSAVAATGALAGIPPTLLSPVAFHGAVLKPLKVKESIVRVDKDKFHSLELKGPLLPHTLPSLCHLIKVSRLEQFSVSCAHVASTMSFSLAGHGCGHDEQPESTDTSKIPQSVFGQESLSDCGFSTELLEHFCNPDVKRVQVLESLKYSNDGYAWT